MIEARHVTKTFDGVAVLSDLSLSVEAGEILGIVGPDGAGKTTLLRLLTGALTAFTGEITVCGSARIEAVKAKLGYIPQKFSLYRDLTVWENIRLLGSLYGASSETIRQKAREILTFTGLWQFRDRLAAQLSGGMKQKLALAASLMHKPAVFFLDEPTTGVDPVARREFWQLLYQMNKDGMTIVAATPYMDEAELCHRVAMLHEGRLLRLETPQRLIDSYPYALLALECARKDLPALLAGCYYADLHAFGNRYHIATDDRARTVRELKRRFAESGISMPPLQETRPSLEDVFVTFSAKGGAWQ